MTQSYLSRQTSKAVQSISKRVDEATCIGHAWDKVALKGRKGMLPWGKCL